MKPGDVVLIRLPTATGKPSKLRPALVLEFLPGPFQNVLICGISAQLRYLQADWDELIHRNDADFVSSGLRETSAVRLSYLYAADVTEIAGVIGRIDPGRLDRLLTRLANLLRPQSGP